MIRVVRVVLARLRFALLDALAECACTTAECWPGTFLHCWMSFAVPLYKGGVHKLRLRCGAHAIQESPGCCALLWKHPA